MRDRTWGLVGHVTFGWRVLRHLSWLGDTMTEAEVDMGHSAGQWWLILHSHTPGQDNVAGTEGG